MSDLHQFQEALGHLGRAEFDIAVEVFGRLLEKSPSQEDYLTGFYISSFWGNRKESIELQQPGRELAVYLLNEWEEFELIVKEKEFTKSPVLPVIRDLILGQAAQNFRQSYQNEGGSVVSDDLLLQLSRCLLRLGDNKNAADVLLFASNQYEQNALFLFMLAEAYARLPDKDSQLKGFSYYRNAFLLDHRKLELDLIDSQPTKKTLQFLQSEFKEEPVLIIEWFPAWFLASIFNEPIPTLSNDDFKLTLTEKERLQGQLNSVKSQYKEKLKAYLSFLLITILKECNRSDVDLFLSELKQVSPELAKICITKP